MVLPSILLKTQKNYNHKEILGKTMKNYTELLRSHELKSTIQRLAILKIIDEAGHLGVEEIYTKIIELYPSVSLNTIYLNVQTMSEKGILIEIPIQNAKSKYEIAKQNHIHFVCTSCGTVEDETDGIKELEKTFKQLSSAAAFAMSSSSVSLYGLCSSCEPQPSCH
jgi:Fe2+ or Zn2+ uptake regulation protein